jgi:hypothetical protein
MWCVQLCPSQEVTARGSSLLVQPEGVMVTWPHFILAEMPEFTHISCARTFAMTFGTDMPFFNTPTVGRCSDKVKW